MLLYDNAKYKIRYDTAFSSYIDFVLDFSCSFRKNGRNPSLLFNAKAVIKCFLLGFSIVSIERNKWMSLKNVSYININIKSQMLIT